MPGPAEAPPKPVPPAVAPAPPSQAEITAAVELLKRAGYTAIFGSRSEGTAGRKFTTYAPAPEGAEPSYRKRKPAAPPSLGEKGPAAK